MTRFGLLRHAQTLWNARRRVQGRLDSPLSPLGREQARRWGALLAQGGWTRILHSDLGRVRESAALVNRTLGLPLHAEPGLREQDWGRWSGRLLPELSGDPELLRQTPLGWDFRPPGGESRREVLCRASQALERAGQRWPGENILVLCHEGVIKCLLYHLEGRAFLPDEPRILRPGRLHLVAWRKGHGLEILQVNALDLGGQEGEAAACRPLC